jgi:hypothetical protein
MWLPVPGQIPPAIFGMHSETNEYHTIQSIAGQLLSISGSPGVTLSLTTLCFLFQLTSGNLSNCSKSIAFEFSDTTRMTLMEGTPDAVRAIAVKDFCLKLLSK